MFKDITPRHLVIALTVGLIALYIAQRFDK